jgi:hypothetical protein
VVYEVKVTWWVSRMGVASSTSSNEKNSLFKDVERRNEQQTFSSLGISSGCDEGPGTSFVLSFKSPLPPFHLGRSDQTEIGRDSVPKIEDSVKALQDYAPGSALWPVLLVPSLSTRPRL